MGRSSGRIQDVSFLQGCLESMDKQLNASETFSQDFRHCRFFRKSRMICENGTLNLRNSQTGSSSCQCSTTSIGHGKETMEFVFRVQKKSRDARKDSWRDTGRFLEGHWTFLGPGDEKKWYGTLPKTPEGKWDSTAIQMVERFKDTGHPAFKSISAFESWNPEKITETSYISMRMLQTASSCSESLNL